MTAPTDQFSRDTSGLPAATSAELVELDRGQRFQLRIAPVTKQLGGASVRMLAYNGSIPGPTLKVRQGSGIDVDVVNDGDLEQTVHWHGLRLDNRSDGTHETQAPIPIGGRFSCRGTFPDPGIYWYHPHIREDYAQEMGLYGNVIVEPEDPDYWGPAHRELCVTLDDVLLEDGQIAPFSRLETNYSAMGRFGDTLLIAGEPELGLTAKQGEVVRVYLTNTANTRVFKVALPGARMKLVGGDSGRVEHEQFIEDVVLAPSERAVVDVLFEQAGELVLEHRTPEKTHRLGTIAVADERAVPDLTEPFELLRRDPELAAERERLDPWLAGEPDKTLAFVAEMDFDAVEGAAVYVCPMHPEVVSEAPGHCPSCGMKLLPQATTYTCPMHLDVVSEEPGRCSSCGMKLLPAQLVAQAGGHDHHEQGQEHHASHAHDHAATGGIEWEDDMVDVNRITTPANTRWKLIDRSTDAANHAIEWRFRVGGRGKNRPINEMDSHHPMHHPLPIHRARPLLLIARGREPPPTPPWGGTV